LGKTLTAARFLASLSSETPRLWVPASRFNRPAELYQALLFDLGLPYQGISEEELRLAVADRLLQTLATGQRTVIVLDESQHLYPELLEEVRLLGNLESRTEKAAFVLLVGLPLLGSNLARPATRAIAHRLAVHARLEPLSELDAITCLREHLIRCGCDVADRVTAEAQEILVAHTQGNPRFLMRATRGAFRLAALAGEQIIDTEAVVGSLATLGLLPEVTSEEDADSHPNVIPHPSTESDEKPTNTKSRRRA
jgi:type II secretory pathway predicted ATPase ExeA